MEVKKIISPLQTWLLAGGRCVGCGVSLAKGHKKSKNGQDTTTCKCGRVFVFDKTSQRYRRALLNEVPG